LIEKEIRDIVPFRNKLAHWTMCAARQDGTGIFKPARSIGIPDTFREKPKAIAAKPIFYDDIVEHYARLQVLVGKIGEFGPAFAKEAEQLPEPSRKLSWSWKPTSFQVD
jgi:hypothetical protein